MPEIALKLPSDSDFVFQPNGWDLATTMGLPVDAETDRHAVDELADAMLVWAGAEADRLGAESAAALWSEELARSIREGLLRVRKLGDEWLPAAESALEELDLLGYDAEISREVARHLAMQLSQLDHPWTFCICCIDESLPGTPPTERRGLARGVALVARRNAGVSEEELRAARVGARFRSPVLVLATDERRRDVRARLGRIGRLSRTSMPLLAAELEAIGAEELPGRPEDDDVWVELCGRLLWEEVRPGWY